MDCPWPRVGPNFMKNKSVAAVSSLLHTPENLRLNSGFPALCPACLCHHVNNYRETLISFFYQQTETCPFGHNWIIWIPHLHKTDLIENPGENFLHKRQLPLCLSGTQFRLLPESEPLATAPFAQINGAYPLLQYKINFGLHNKIVELGWKLIPWTHIKDHSRGQCISHQRCG